MKKQRKTLQGKYSCAFCGATDLAIIQKIFSNTSTYLERTVGGLLYLTEDNHLICDSCICDAAIPIKLSGQFAVGYKPVAGKRVKLATLDKILNTSPLKSNPIKHVDIQGVDTSLMDLGEKLMTQVSRI